MTARQHYTLLGVLGFLSTSLLVIALLHLRHVGEAYADTPPRIVEPEPELRLAQASVGPFSDPGPAAEPSATPASSPSIEPPAAPAAAASPADELDTDDVSRLWRSGQFIAAGAVVVFLLLTFLVRIDPKRAFYWTSGLTAIGVIIDAVVAGATPSLGLLLTAVSTLVALVVRGPLPTPAPAPSSPATDRDPQRGAAGLDVVIGTVLSLATIGALCFAIGCSAAKQGARAVAGDVVDCTIGVAKQHSDEYGTLIEAVLRGATRGDGSVDWSTVKAATKGFGVQTGGCVLATVVGRLATAGHRKPAPQGLLGDAAGPPEPDPTALVAGFAAARAELFGGARFKTAAGEL